jgi:hypothetical protein
MNASAAHTAMVEGFAFMGVFSYRNESVPALAVVPLRKTSVAILAVLIANCSGRMHTTHFSFL